MKIVKPQVNNDLDASKTVSEIVRADYRRAPVFRKYNINYCCGGLQSLHAVCEQLGINQAALLEELTEATRNISLPTGLQFHEWKTDFLIDYIINVHHAYLYKVIPELIADLLAFSENHKIQLPELAVVYKTFNGLAELLLANNRNEEVVLFPYVRQLDSAFTKREPYAQLFVRTLKKPLHKSDDQHILISDLINKVKAFTNNYKFPETACTNHRVIYRKLQEFHDDLIQHKHLENNILLPRATEMERQLLLH